MVVLVAVKVDDLKSVGYAVAMYLLDMYADNKWEEGIN